MKSVVIANPAAAAGTVGRRWEQHNRTITEVYGLSEVIFTSCRGEATELTRRALRDGAERIVAVGGDGTINEVVNGFFDERGEALGAGAALALYPAGTGGDLARSLGLDGGERDRALLEVSERRCDLGRATLRTRNGDEVLRYFINIASFGASGLIVEKVNTTTKRFGGRASFMWGTMKGLLAYRNQRLRVRVDDVFEEDVLVNTVAVANGRYFGGGMMVAPEARVDDGLFDIVIIGDISVGTFVRYSGRIYAGTHGTLPEIRMMRGKRVTVTPLAREPVLVDTDGEQAGVVPAEFEIVPRALRLIAPWGRAVAVSSESAVHSGR